METLILFTGYALIAVVCVVAAFAAHHAAERAAHAANSLQNSRGRIIALEGATQNLDDKLRKLSGRVYYDETRKRRAAENGDDAATLAGRSYSDLAAVDGADGEVAAMLALQKAPPGGP